MAIETPSAAFATPSINGTNTYVYPFNNSKFEDDDVFVYLYNSSTGNYDVQTVTTHYAISGNTITFTSIPTTQVLILRRTDFNALKIPNFTPGSSIRGEDLDSNFTQLLRVSQEFRDLKVDKFFPEVKADLNMNGQSIDSLGAATTDGSAVNREQLGNIIAQDITGNASQGVVLTKTQSGSNSGDEMVISVQDSSTTDKGVVSINQATNEAINVSYSSGTATIGVDKSTASQQGVVRIQATAPIDLQRSADGEVALDILDNTVDLAKLKQDDVVTLAEQNTTPNAAGNDDEVATFAALNKRHDIIYQSGTPSGTDFITGKIWYDHANDQTLSIWDGTNWLGVSSGGTFITQPTVIWVDSVNGSDTNDGHRVIDPMKTIKAAVASADHGDIVLVTPGVYQEVAPIDITVNNLSIIGQSLRSCFVHPTQATELNSLFRVNSGTQIQNFSFGGLKASGTRGGHAIDNDSTYGLPTNQAFVAEFYPNSIIYKSPYIQNCTNFADSAIDNNNFDPNNVNQGGFGGDLTSGPTGGGILVDGSAVSSSSPLRSMVVDAFTQITLDGPGILCTNNGYAQLVSFFGTFCHYHAKALNGGQLNLSNCTTDYGRYGLIADGKSPTANFTASVSAAASTGDTTFTIGAPTAGSGWYGSATRPQDNMLVVIGSNTYSIRSAVANGSGWDVTIENPDPAALGTNLGLAAGLSIGDSASFHNRSYISTGGHTFEYVGAGTDYRAAPENGGVAIEANQVKNLNNGKVFQSSTDHNGKFKVGETLTVDQRTGEVIISLDAYRPELVNDLTPQLGGDLDVNGKNITGTVKLNGLTYPASDGATDQIIKTDGNGNLSFVAVTALQGAGMQNVSDDSTPQLGGELDALTNKITNLGTPTANADAATKAYVDTTVGNIDAAFIETSQTLTANKTIATNTNAACVGPIAINSGITLTISSNSKLLVLS
tara:strand:+ start:547 stop:3384 length:2838 start_codon:yes stop_codon:yes gene_type:complete